MSSAVSAVRRGLAAAVTLALVVAMAGTAQAVVPTKPAQTWGVNGRVLAILPLSSGKVVVGGSFTSVVNSTGTAQFPVTNIALFDPATGTFDSSWRPNVSNSVNALAVSGDGSRLYVGGAFSAKLAAINVATGSVDSTWTGPTLDGPVDVIRLSGDSLFIGGNWNTVTSGGVSTPQASVVRLNASTGAPVPSFNPVLHAVPESDPSVVPGQRAWALLVLSDGRVVVGGDFSDVDNVPNTRRIAILNPDSGDVVTSFKSVANNNTSIAPILDLATDGSRIYEAVAGSGGACTAVNVSTGAKVWSIHSNGNMQSVRVVGSTVYCGGHFSGTGSFGGLTRSKIAAVDPATGAISPWAPVINSALGVWSMGSDATHLYLGGDFTKAGGVAAQHFAMWVDSASATVPLAPTLSATAGDAVVHLGWQPPSNDGGSPILRYKIWRKLAGASSYPNAALATVTSGTAYDDATVTNGTAYTYEVLAVNSVGNGAPSNEVTVTPGSTAQSLPSAPQSLTASVGSTAVTLNWSPSSSPGNPAFTRYDIYRGTASGAETLLANVPAGTTTYSDSLPPQGTTYFYTVRAVSTFGSGPASNEASTAGSSTGAPAAPTLSGSVSGTSVVLNWTPGSGGGAVEKWVVLRDAVRIATITDPAVTTYTDSNVLSGTYVYKIRAGNSVGNSPNSNAVTLTVP